MHSRRLITFLLGAWLGGMVLVAVFATENFRTADRILDLPLGSAKKVMIDLGGHARPLIRHEVSEINRAMFETWEWIQLGIGFAVIGIVVFSRRHTKERVLITLGITGAMLLLVVVQRVMLTPEMIGTGRLLDFGEAANVERERRVFGSLHMMYGITEVLKGIIGLGYLVILLRANAPVSARPATTGGSGSGSGNRKRRRRSSESDGDGIDEAEHSHVDG